MYPQQYPKPYPYYYQQQPPKKDDKMLIIVLVIVVVVAIVLPVMLAFVLYMTVIDREPDGHVVPTGVWGAKTIVSSTEVRIEFGKVSPEPRPVELDIVLVRNGADYGMYGFESNDDGMLSHLAGYDLGTLTYEDLADNRRINTGDRLRMSNLTPGSDYDIRMIWEATGDMITRTTFSTPG